ncbi:TetR family transcriptional regulator [Streptomyces sp. DSM 42041]|uniref:TetR family transcriptional regulator n=1 Tax=Streptomyces hazeniae TaxID=3075538 RepID=A0ABU2NP61_9ACTN|nr:TetR family transcriptional regulator [Streptomyces sp. DSM 42041]MDT0378565.1 TetR family transcriptional regulator [Streptomyces sp. DSM 42041]
MEHGEVLLLDAAIEVLAAGGMQSLTHQEVDARAGVPEGSTSHLYRTRDELLGAVLRRVLERENAVWALLPVVPGASTIEGFADRMGRLLQILAGPERTLTMARQAVFAHVATSPGLRAELRSARSGVNAWLSPLLAELGSRHPEGDLDMLLVFMDGLLASQVAGPTPGWNPSPAIAALLHGLIERQAA